MVGQLQYCPTSRLKQKFLKQKRNNIMGGNMDGLIVAAIAPWIYITFLIIYFTRSFWSELPIKKYNFFSALSFVIGMTILIKNLSVNKMLYLLPGGLVSCHGNINRGKYLRISGNWLNR